jgi:hypothetical protein
MTAIPAIKLTSNEKLRSQPGEEGNDSATALIGLYRNHGLPIPENNNIPIKYAYVKVYCKVGFEL